MEQLRQAPGMAGMVVWNQNIGFESTKRDMTKKNDEKCGLTNISCFLILLVIKLVQPMKRGI